MSKYYIYEATGNSHYFDEETNTFEPNLHTLDSVHVSEEQAIDYWKNNLQNGEEYWLLKDDCIIDAIHRLV